MNQPEGYVLVQIKQLAQWRDWANNVAAWSRQADRSSEVARLKASISSAMISATLPPASAAGEREGLLRGEVDAITELNHTQWLALENVRTLAARHRKEEWAQHLLRWCDEAGNASRTLRAALATKPQAEQAATPPAQTVQDSERATLGGGPPGDHNGVKAADRKGGV